MKLSAIRAALAELGLTPSKTLGQNFLHDQNLARWIVAQVDARPDDQLVEIGPGLGALTAAALATGARVTALEKDGRLAEYLRRRFEGEAPFEVVSGDALEYDVRTLWPRRPVKVFGNLPYYVSTPLIFHFTSPAAPVERAVFLLQRELAERLAAGPGTKAYGIVSVVLGRAWRIKLLKVLPASVFLPEPNVDSALISLQRRGPGELPPCDPQTFDRIVRAGFSQRRKQLRKMLSALGEEAAPVLARWAAVTGALGVAETVRGEELGLLQWIALANVFAPVEPSAAQDAQRERFDVVDARDQVVGVESRGVVHATGLRHRAVHLFVFNGRGELFLQKRSPWKDKCPGKWDSSAAGHLDSGESYATAARREAAEELGIDPEQTPLREVGALSASEATGWEFVRIFETRHEGPFRWPPEEIEWGGFFPVATVQDWSTTHPEDFAPGFLECWRVWREAAPAEKPLDRPADR